VHLGLDYDGMLASSESAPGAIPTWFPALVREDACGSTTPLTSPASSAGHGHRQGFRSSDGDSPPRVPHVTLPPFAHMESGENGGKEQLLALSPRAVARTLDVVTTAALWRESDHEPHPGACGSLPSPSPVASRRVCTAEEVWHAATTSPSSGSRTPEPQSSEDDGCLDLDLVLALHLAKSSSATQHAQHTAAAHATKPM